LFWDVRKLIGNDAADDRVSRRQLGYPKLISRFTALVQPAVRAFASAPLARWLQKLHPLRLQFELFSDANPLMAGIA
jgi:hypothetical protein